MNDKARLLRAVLAEKGIELRDTYGEQNIRCPYHDDRRASARVHAEKGLFFCHACGVSGDAYDLIKHETGGTFADAQRYAERYIDGSGEEVQRDSSERQWVPSRSRTVGRGNRQWVPPRLRKKS